MSEKKLQGKTLTWLKDNGFWSVKIIVATRSGVSDIVGCTPKGRFFCIELKSETGKPTPLQLWNLEEVRKRGGIAILAYDLETVISALCGELLHD